MKNLTTEIYKGIGYYGIIVRKDGEYLTTLTVKTKKYAKEVSNSYSTLLTIIAK
jgi:hypothetical protein